MRRVIQIPLIILLFFWCGLSHAEKSSPVIAPSSLRFTENKGQWASYVKYMADLNGGRLIAEKDKLTWVFWDTEAVEEGHHHHSNPIVKLHAFKMNFEGSNVSNITASAKDFTYRNYFLDNDPAHWASNVGMYQKITYKSLYAGVDAEILGSGDNLKYNFIVAPNASPAPIKIKYEGVDELQVVNGELRYKITFGTFTELQPYAYQTINGFKQEVACEYKLDNATNTVSFVFPNGYNSNYQLIIDPILVFASYTGSTADNWGFSATDDNQANLYAGGIVFQFRSAYSPGSGVGQYPTVGAFQSTFQGGDQDISISKFVPDGTALMYSTYLGGNANDSPHSLVVNNNGELYVLGSTTSTNFPVIAGAFDVTHAFSDFDIIVAKFNGAGNSLLGATYVGGSGDDGQNLSNLGLNYNYGDNVRGEIIVDSFSNVYVASSTLSSDFPVTPGAFQTSAGSGQNGCVFKMNSALTQMLWATYLGGSSDDASYSVKLDNTNNVLVAGGTVSSNFPNVGGGLLNSYQGGTSDGYICKFTNNGTFIKSSFIGTSAYDQCYFIEVDKNNDVFLVGQTLGNYPITAGVYNNPGTCQFIQKLDNNLGTSLMSTRFGSGSSAVNISPTAFLVDNCFNIYVAGWGGNVNQSHSPQTGTTSGMPVTAGALKSITDGSDLYFAVFDENCSSLLYGTFYGGNAPVGEHVDGGTCRFDKDGVMYSAVCSGCGNNDLFPASPGAYSTTNNSSNCNLSALKIDFQLSGTEVEVNAFPRATGCVPLTVQFQSVLSNVQSVQWFFGDGDSSTAINPVHVYNDTGVYVVMLIGIDPTSCNLRDTAYLDVWVRDDSISANFTPGVDIDCDSNKVMIISQNYPTTQYSWTFGDGGTSNNDTAIHYYANPGTYAVTLIVSDTSKCNLQDTFVQPIRIPPILNANFSLNDSSGCVPLGVTFNAQNISTANYLWNFGDNTTATGNAATHIYNTQGSFTVMLVVTDTTSCNIADTAIANIVTIDSSADADFNVSRIFFGCDSVMVTVWSEYQGEESELWDFGDGFTSTLDTVSHTYTTGGNFTLTHYLTDVDMICKPLDTMDVIISLTPLHISATVPDSLGCYPFTATFTGNSLLLTTNYFWFFGDGDSASGSPVSHTYNNVGTFNVITVAVDSNACVSADTVYSSITVINDSVEAIFNLTVLNDCDSNLLINLTNNSINALQYQWYFSDGTSDNTTNPSHTFTLPGTYTVTLVSIDTNRCHPTDTAIQSVTMRPNSWVDFTTENVCDSVTVSFTNLGSNTANYVWNFGDGSNASTYNASHLYALPNTYTVQLTITDTTTCDINSTATHDVTVYTLPKAMFDMQKDTFKYLTEVDFINLSTDYNMSIWDFGDGVVSADNSPTHFYSNTIGWVDVCLNVYTDGIACYDTLCDSIYISYDGIIGVPNAFTPNGDGINDIIRIEGKGIIELDFRIYNRWGEQVFRSTDQKIGWDGYYKGVLQEMESYTYTAECTLINLNKINLKGNITLLR